MINQYFEIARLIAKQISGELDKVEQSDLKTGEKNLLKTSGSSRKYVMKRTLPPTYADAIHSTQTWVGRR